jgi:hypothetical protein
MSIEVRAAATEQQPLIPGAYERNTLTHRQAGSMGGPAFGSANAATGPSSLDAALIADREKEGGGGTSQRSRATHVQPAASTVLTVADQRDARRTRPYSWLQILRLARR